MMIYTITYSCRVQLIIISYVQDIIWHYLVKHVATQGGERADMAQGGGNNPAKLSGW